MPHTYPDTGTTYERDASEGVVISIDATSRHVPRRASAVAWRSRTASEAFVSHPGWFPARTAEVLAELHGDHRIIGACGETEPSTLRWIGRQLATGPGQTVLDCGIGLGGPATWLARSTGAAFVGLDADDGALAGLRRLFPSQPAVRGRVEALPFADASVDHAIALGVLDRVGSLQRVARSVARVLRPGGRFVAVFRVRGHDASVDERTARLRPAAALLHPFHEAGFDSVALEPLTPPAALPHDWRRTRATVERALRDRYGGDVRLRAVVAERRRLERLAAAGSVSLRGLTAVRAPA